jgi:hypothetical protein
MAKFAKLPDLEELRLRGVCGLVLPSFSFSGGLEELSSLKKLKKLVSALSKLQVTWMISTSGRQDRIYCFV